MVDVGATIDPKSSQQNAEDYLTGPKTVTITKVTATEAADQPVAISFIGDDGRPFLPCKTVRRVLVHAWGRNGADYVGRSMTLFCDPTVKWGGAEVGGIRVSHLSHIPKPLTIALTATRGNKKPITVKPLVIDVSSEDTLDEAAIKQEAIAAARQGKEAFNAHWKTLTKPQRMSLQPIMDDLKALAIEHDEPAADDYNEDITDETETKDVF